MDEERAVQHLESFLGLLATNRAAFALKDKLFVSNTQWRETQEQILSRRPLILAIADELDHVIAKKMRERSTLPWEWEDTEEAAGELLGLLRDRAEFHAVFGRTIEVDSGPHVHRSIWKNAAALWEDAQFGQAVKEAIGFVLGVLLPSKLGRFDLAGVELVTEAFSLEPPRPGRARLRLPNLTPDTEAWEDAHSGAKHFGVGCILAVRSVTIDHPHPIDENAAMELLISLSTFARWIDQAEVVHWNGAQH